MHYDLFPKDDKDLLYLSKREWGKGYTSTEDSPDASIWQLGDSFKRQNNYSGQEEQWQYKNKQNNYKKETVIGSRTTVWIFQATNGWNLTGEDLGMATNGVP